MPDTNDILFCREGKMTLALKTSHPRLFMVAGPPGARMQPDWMKYEFAPEELRVATDRMLSGAGFSRSALLGYDGFSPDCHPQRCQPFNAFKGRATLLDTKTLRLWEVRGGRLEFLPLADGERPEPGELVEMESARWNQLQLDAGKYGASRELPQEVRLHLERLMGIPDQDLADLAARNAESLAAIEAQEMFLAAEMQGCVPAASARIFETDWFCLPALNQVVQSAFFWCKPRAGQERLCDMLLIVAEARLAVASEMKKIYGAILPSVEKTTASLMLKTGNSQHFQRLMQAAMSRQAPARRHVFFGGVWDGVKFGAGEVLPLIRRNLNFAGVETGLAQLAVADSNDHREALALSFERAYPGVLSSGGKGFSDYFGATNQVHPDARAWLSARMRRK